MCYRHLDILRLFILLFFAWICYQRLTNPRKSSIKPIKPTFIKKNPRRNWQTKTWMSVLMKFVECPWREPSFSRLYKVRIRLVLFTCSRYTYTLYGYINETCISMKKKMIHCYLNNCVDPCFCISVKDLKKKKSYIVFYNII